MPDSQRMRLHGLVAAAHTPFAADGSLNLAIVEKQAAHYIENGISFAFIGGSTGEFQSLSLEERRALAKRWLEVTRETKLRTVVHVGSNCLVDSKALAADAEKLGAVAIATLAPSYYKPRSVEALVAWSAEVAGAAPQTPFYFYDIPSMTGISLSMPEFLKQAAGKVPTLAGLKFTTADLMSYLQCLELDDRKWDVAWGVDEWLLGALATGARGAVGSSYNFAAPIYQRLMAAFARGDLPAARVDQHRSAQMISLLGKYSYMAAAKATMAMLGVDVGSPRMPNESLSAEKMQALRKDLETLGFFDWIRKEPASGPSKT